MTMPDDPITDQATRLTNIEAKLAILEPLVIDQERRIEELEAQLLDVESRLRELRRRFMEANPERGERINARRLRQMQELL